MPGRKYVAGSSSYRYGLNGQEKSPEVNVDGNLYTAEFWQYDSRIGRRWNVDPKPTEYESPYATFSNNPIAFADPLGDTPVPAYKNLQFLLKSCFGPGGKTLSKLIPSNSTGNSITGAVVGSGQAMVDGIEGVKQLVRHPINTVKSIGSNLFTTDPVGQAVNLSQQYINSVNINGSAYTNSFLLFYGITSFASTKYTGSIIGDLSQSTASLLKFERFKGGGTYASYGGQDLGYYNYTKAKGLELDLNIPSNLQGKGLGTKIFSDAMMSTGAKKFTATWIESTDYATGASVNLERYRAALRNSTATEAAWKTWSGQQAAANGFKNVSVKPIQGGRGVEAIFTK